MKKENLNASNTQLEQSNNMIVTLNTEKSGTQIKNNRIRYINQRIK